MDCGPPCSSVHGILQEKILEWVAIHPLWDLPEPEIKPSVMSSALADGSLPLAPPPILVVYFRHSGSMRGEEVSEVVARWVWARTQGMGSFSFHLPLRGI